MKRQLFPEEVNDSSSSDLFGINYDSTSVTDSLGGNLHQLNENQINKLISLKFNNQPISLIRQLSYDLALKELELILLRKEKFLREQELLKLCNQYGNLSNLEIDKKLNSVQVDENVDNVVLGLIKNAINDELQEGISTRPADKIVKANTEEEPVSRPPKPTRWISDWFKESTILRGSLPNLSSFDDGSDSGGIKGNKSHLHASLISLPITNSSSETRIPVELDTIYTKPERDMPDVYFNTGIDKYGFLNDLNNLAEKEVTPTHAPKPENVDSNKNNTSITDTNSLKVNGTTNVRLKTPSIDKLKEISEIHDAKSRQFETKWDSFFKDLIKDYYKHADQDIHNYDENVISAISTHEMFGGRGLNLIKHERKLASNSINSHGIGQLKILRGLIIENGIPPKYRYNLWLELSGAKNLRVPGEFENLIKEANGDNNEIIKSNIRQIDLDLRRTLPSNIFFNDFVNGQPGPNFYKLQNILYAFSAYNRDIGYCQGMNKIVGNLLLGVKKFEQEDIFWIFTAFIEETLPRYRGYHFFDINSLPLIRIDQKVIMLHYFPRLLPKLHTHFIHLNVQIEYITLNWWLLLFTDGLPLEIWFKLFDNFLVSNVDTAFIALTLSLFKLFEKRLLEMNSCNDIYIVMKNLNHSLETSKINIRYQDLMSISTTFEKKIAKEDLSSLRDLYSN